MEDTKKLGQYDIIGVGGFLTIIAFIVLFIIKEHAPELLDIDAKWLLVCFSPMLIALIISGFIKKIKGGGLEFDLNTEISRFPNLIFEIPVDEQQYVEKGPLDFISRHPGIATARVLKLKMSPDVHYVPDIIQEYIKAMRNVKYLLFVDNYDRFSFIVKFRENPIEYSSREGFLSFTNSLANYLNREVSSFGYIERRKITDTVKKDTSIDKLFDKFHETNSNYLPVVDGNNYFIGIIERNKVNAAIAEKVVYELKRKK